MEAALWARDMPKAMRLSEDAVGAGAEHPTLAGAGRRWSACAPGDNDSALPLLLRARQQTPRHVDLLYALGECLTRLGRPREAVEPFDAAHRHRARSAAAFRPGHGAGRFERAGCGPRRRSSRRWR